MNNIHNAEEALFRAGVFSPQQSEWSWPTCPSAGQGSRRVARLGSLEGLGCEPRLLRARSISSSGTLPLGVPRRTFCGWLAGN